MIIDTKRLATDAAYWDEVAPEGATHHDPADNSESCWMMKISEKAWAFHDTEFWTSLDYADVEHDIDNYIPRPTKPAAPEWGGEGLPPVGCECEVSYAGYWVKATAVHVTVIGHVVFEMHGNYAGSVRVVDRAELVRPIRTKEQRQRDDLSKLIEDSSPIKGDGTWATGIIDAILSRYNLEPKP